MNEYILEVSNSPLPPDLIKEGIRVLLKTKSPQVRTLVFEIVSFTSAFECVGKYLGSDDNLISSSKVSWTKGDEVSFDWLYVHKIIKD